MKLITMTLILLFPILGHGSGSYLSGPDSLGRYNKLQSFPAKKLVKATFGGGCFWGIEEKFRQIDGVSATRVGYIDGKTKNPSYKDVSYKNSGHAEVVEVTYNPERVKYDELVKLFFAIHDASQLNRQGPDVGVQYRSAIYTHGDKQQSTASKIKARIQKNSRYKNKKIVTEIKGAVKFYPAETYHQQYFEKKRRALHQ